MFTAENPVVDPSVMIHNVFNNWLNSESDTNIPNFAVPAGGGIGNTRNPVEEEKIRILVISAAQFWLLVARNDSMRSRLLNLIDACQDPQKWAVLAAIFWGGSNRGFFNLSPVDLAEIIRWGDTLTGFVPKEIPKEQDPNHDLLQALKFRLQDLTHVV